jgi:hypothetical protein
MIVVLAVLPSSSDLRPRLCSATKRTPPRPRAWLLTAPKGGPIIRPDVKLGENGGRPVSARRATIANAKPEWETSAS